MLKKFIRSVRLRIVKPYIPDDDLMDVANAVFDLKHKK